jgi:hypothetical protein
MLLVMLLARDLAVLLCRSRSLLLRQHLVALLLGLRNDGRRAQLAIVKLLLHLGRLRGNHLGIGNDLALWRWMRKIYNSGRGWKWNERRPAAATAPTNKYALASVSTKHLDSPRVATDWPRDWTTFISSANDKAGGRYVWTAQFASQRNVSWVEKICSMRRKK